MAVEVTRALGGADKTKAIDFDFFTAGSGGAGATILSATFLILSEKVSRGCDRPVHTCHQFAGKLPRGV